MSSTAGVDGLSGSTRPWRVVAFVVLALGVGGFVLGFAGVIPFGVGLASFAVSVPILMVIDIQERRLLEEEFTRVVLEPTWTAASGGLLDLPRGGRLWTFSGDGRLARRRRARPDRLLIAFDDVAFVIVARGPILSALRRRIIRKGEPADFAVHVSSSGGCVLEERLGGMRARLVAGSTGRPPGIPTSMATPEERSHVAERVAGALASTGWM